MLVDHVPSNTILDGSVRPVSLCEEIFKNHWFAAAACRCCLSEALFCSVVCQCILSCSKSKWEAKCGNDCCCYWWRSLVSPGLQSSKVRSACCTVSTKYIKAISQIVFRTFRIPISKNLKGSLQHNEKMLYS